MKLYSFLSFDISAKLNIEGDIGLHYHTNYDRKKVWSRSVANVGGE
jgi:hypothetical protein